MVMGMIMVMVMMMVIMVMVMTYTSLFVFYYVHMTSMVMDNEFDHWSTLALTRRQCPPAAS